MSMDIGIGSDYVLVFKNSHARILIFVLFENYLPEETVQIVSQFSSK